MVWMMMRMVVNAEGGAEMDAKDYYYDDDGSTRSTAPPLKMMMHKKRAACDTPLKV